MGGAWSPPGVDFEFDSASGGTLSALFESIPTSMAGGIDDPTGVNFALASEPLQLWALDYDGSFTGAITLTFAYDDTTLLVPEADLKISHYEGEAWIELPKLAQDLVENTITVTTTSLSPFVLAGLVAASDQLAARRSLDPQRERLARRVLHGDGLARRGSGSLPELKCGLEGMPRRVQPSVPHSASTRLPDAA